MVSYVIRIVMIFQIKMLTLQKLQHVSSLCKKHRMAKSHPEGYHFSVHGS